jgi:hypothetical protein
VFGNQAIRYVEVAFAHAQVVDRIEQVGFTHAVLADETGQALRALHFLEVVVFEVSKLEGL